MGVWVRVWVDGRWVGWVGDWVVGWWVAGLDGLIG